MEANVIKSYYWYLSLTFVLILIMGFGPQFFWRPLTGRPPLSIFSFFHALFGVGWVAIYAFQVWLIRKRKIVDHRKVGIWSSIVAVGLFVSGFGMIYRFLQLYIDSGEAYMDPTALIIGNALAMCFFAIFFIFGYRYRRRPLIHKQFMTIATIFMLGPAIARLSRYPFTKIFEDFGTNEALWGIGGSIILFISLIIFSKKRLVSSLGLICFLFTLITVGYLSASGSGVRLIEGLYK